MALVLNDRVKETTTTTGTGTINLGGAATGFETFVAGIGNSNTTYYCIAGQGTAEFEVGIGTVTDASPDTLSRTTILSSSNSDSAVNFSAGTKDVFCTLPASKTIREVDTALNVPTGTTAQRAGSPAAGDLRFNTTTSKFEGYSGSAWGDIGVGNFLVTNTFTGDGSDTTFTISNAVADENNLLVFIDGVFQAQNVYSISGTTLTFATAPANNRVITVYSALNNIQGANVVKATMTGDNSDTTLALGVTPISENAVQVYFDGVYQNKDSFSISGETLTFGVAPPTGVAVEAITLTVTDLAAAASSILVDEFTGDGSDTTFTLSAAPANENNTQVFVGGVYQEKATYSISGTTLTFSEAPANTVSIEVVSVAVGQINSAIQLSDADGDTKVQVEESSDEDKIRFDTAGSERMVIDNSGNVGIGITNPSDYYSEQLVVNAEEGEGGITIKNATDNTGYLMFADGTSGNTAYRGYIMYGHTADELRLYGSTIQTLYTNGSERMRIASDGKVFIATTSAARTTSGHEFHTDGFARHTADGDKSMELVRTSSFGEMVEFFKDTSLIGSVGAYTTGRLYIGSGDTAITFASDYDAIYPINATTQSARDDAIDLGYLSGARFDDIVATNGTIQTSDQNEKNTIAESDLGLDFVKKLSPKSYKFNGKTRTHYGLIAQDIETVLSDINKPTTDFAGFIKGDISEEQDGSNYRYGLRYNEFIAPLIKAIQELSAKVEELEGKIE